MTSEASARGGGPVPSARPGSPPFGFSTFTTSAPSQARASVQDGPASNCERSRTRTPSRQFGAAPASSIADCSFSNPRSVTIVQTGFRLKRLSPVSLFGEPDERSLQSSTVCRCPEPGLRQGLLRIAGRQKEKPLDVVYLPAGRGPRLQSNGPQIRHFFSR